ncbi:extracellular serine/threonine protein kinase four-jointed [Aricia agestis]|uniref:extracellular serine/threonine protein kinase four-jointed n=1 Tax=Aricia agestis TaxID=91739 RepID=UPI001C2098FC|nr:extracellular serine/threonine protein kinase four-jointed [Aricia agestis]XP_041970943.1 extracellular serine/threonine protein kinase four-jointed [Aricia agestis]XP_041970945.1 extracellular serine/threonine protein kinase four-jointed [Aricia agestis]
MAAENPQEKSATKHIQYTLPTFKNINEKLSVKLDRKINIAIDQKMYNMRRNFIIYSGFGYRRDLMRRNPTKKDCSFYNYCLLSVLASFILGLVIGVAIVRSTQSHVIAQSFKSRRVINLNSTRDGHTRTLNSIKMDSDLKINDIDVSDKDLGRFIPVSFTGDKDIHKQKMDVYPKGLTDHMKEILRDNKETNHRHSISNINLTVHVPNDRTILYENIFWGPEVENSMPQGYGENSAEVWEKYIDQSEVVKMEAGCGRMQNRLVTFKDGVQACVRYRQNTDQIQGEIFSFYLARLLNLTNLAPSVVKVVDLKDKLWNSVANDIATAQWNSNRAVVLTQYIPSLESATIPDIFKPSNRHLNKIDVMNMSLKENDTIQDNKQILINKLKNKGMKTKSENTEKFDHIDVKLNKKTIDSFVELAQWSDLIIFDYLTANLDRIVNNLFNYQWNINIMDGPAHNLARKMDSGLLVFLDNESGLLHGYRLLKKYNVYHSLMLDNLCVFRKRTVDALKQLHSSSVGSKISEMFHSKNNAVIRDILPPLPEKNAKILHDRIGKVLSQIESCEQKFANR